MPVLSSVVRHYFWVGGYKIVFGFTPDVYKWIGATVPKATEVENQSFISTTYHNIRCRY